MAIDDDRPHDWDPEKEKRSTDPKELAREFVRAAAQEQKKIDEENKKAKREVGGGVYTPPAPPAMDLQMGVHKITNGYIVLWGLAPARYPAQRNRTKEIYAATPEAAREALAALLVDFFAGKLPDDPEGPFGPVMGPYAGPYVCGEV